MTRRVKQPMQPMQPIIISMVIMAIIILLLFALTTWSLVLSTENNETNPVNPVDPVTLIRVTEDSVISTSGTVIADTSLNNITVTIVSTADAVTVINGVGTNLLTVAIDDGGTINGLSDTVDVVNQLQLFRASDTAWVTSTPQSMGAVEMLIDPSGTPLATVQNSAKLYGKDSTTDLFWQVAGSNEVNITGPILTGTSVINVRTASDFVEPLSSNKVYVIDGEIDMGSKTIIVPPGGLQLSGLGFDISSLKSSSDGYTLFFSTASGNLLLSELAIEITGSASKVFDLTSNTNFDAFEHTRVNFNNCTSLGEITNYRQGLETGTGRFGGTPTLTLSGSWVGGYFIDTSIVRSLSSGMVTPLFSAGPGFVMQSRFRSNQNIDLAAAGAFVDFSPSNFPNSSTLQLTTCIISRNGVFNAGDTTIIPNIDASDLSSSWTANNGIPNTFVGGMSSVVGQVATTITVISQFERIAGTWNATGLQHFNSPSEGELQHDGSQPNEFVVFANIELDGSPNNTVTMRLMKDDGFGGLLVVTSQTRSVNNIVGGQDRAFFTISANTILNTGESVFFEVANDSSTDDVTLLTSSFYNVNER